MLLLPAKHQLVNEDNSENKVLHVSLVTMVMVAIQLIVPTLNQSLLEMVSKVSKEIKESEVNEGNKENEENHVLHKIMETEVTRLYVLTLIQ